MERGETIGCKTKPRRGAGALAGFGLGGSKLPHGVVTSP